MRLSCPPAASLPTLDGLLTSRLLVVVAGKATLDRARFLSAEALLGWRLVRLLLAAARVDKGALVPRRHFFCLLQEAAAPDVSRRSAGRPSGG